MSELTITKEKVLEAASKCSTAKSVLEVMFPEVFKQGNEPLFKDGDVLSANSYSGPIMIAVGCAPTGLEYKCLLVDSDYKASVMSYEGYELIKFELNDTNPIKNRR